MVNWLQKSLYVFLAFELSLIRVSMDFPPAPKAPAMYVHLPLIFPFKTHRCILPVARFLDGAMVLFTDLTYK